MSQDLIYKGKILKNEKFVSDYNIENNHTIMLVVKHMAPTTINTSNSTTTSYKNYHIIPHNNSDLSQEKRINELIEDLNKSKKINEQLNNTIKELNNKLNSENEFNLNKIKSLQYIINQKDEELNKLKEK